MIINIFTSRHCFCRHIRQQCFSQSAYQDHVVPYRCRSRQFFGMQRIPCPNFRNLLEKFLWNKRTLYKLSVAAETLYFPLQSWHRFENRKFGT